MGACTVYGHCTDTYMGVDRTVTVTSMVNGGSLLYTIDDRTASVTGNLCTEIGTNPLNLRSYMYVLATCELTQYTNCICEVLFPKTFSWHLDFLKGVGAGHAQMKSFFSLRVFVLYD